MKAYQSHTRVKAFKIDSINDDSSPVILTGGNNTQFVSDKFVAKYSPKIGGYFIEHENGYCFYLPAKIFESEYSLLGDPAIEPPSDP